MIKINMGCGKRNFGNDWVHLDGYSQSKKFHIGQDKLTDIYGDNTVDLIYASHVIEYFDREEIVPLLEEWVRVLKPEGILRVAVPDFRAMACLYIMGHLGKKYPLEQFLGPLYGKMDMKDSAIYHRTVYDYDSLRSLLESIGLHTVRRWDWRKVEHGQFDDHSQAYVPHMDKENGTLISLNLQGYKNV